MIDLATLFPARGLKPKTAGEWCGPCPDCGGFDRFLFWPDRGRWYCRQCGINGDLIDYLTKFEGLSFSDAARLAGREVVRPAGHIQKPAAPLSPARQREKATSAAGDELPPEAWSAAAAEFLATCQQPAAEDSGMITAWGPEFIAALSMTGRGNLFSRHVNLGIGWNIRSRYADRESWGLPPVKDQAGKIHSKLSLPAGIVIGVSRAGRLCSLVIRLKEPQNGFRYWHVKGGPELPAIYRTDATAPVFVFESGLDAALLHACTGYTGIGLNGTNGKIDRVAGYLMEQAAAGGRLYLSMDNDAAGIEAETRFLAAYPRARIARAIEPFKDISEMEKACFELDKDEPIPDVKQWASSSLQG